MQPPDGDFMTSEAHSQPYLELAAVVLRHYPLGPAIPTFIGHNAGIVFRVEAPEIGQTYVLKLHERVGYGPNPSAEQLDAGLRWLADLARDTAVVVQVPVATSAGQLVGQIVTGESSTPLNYTLQHWVAGEPPNGDLTAQQAHRVGKMMATLHAFSERYAVAPDAPAMRHDTDALRKNIDILRGALPTTLLSREASAIVDAAGERITALMADLGVGHKVWGPVHGDIHYDNLLFYQDEARPIDFTGLRLAHYGYDIGVTLYHILYQEPEIRRAFVEGYERVRPLPAVSPRALEAFLTYAAIDNVAWNSTIAAQVRSPLFQRNVRHLVDAFCTRLVAGQSFLFE